MGGKQLGLGEELDGDKPDDETADMSEESDAALRSCTTQCRKSSQ